MTLWVPVAVLLVIAVLLYAGWRRGRLGLAFAGAAAGLLAIWVGSAFAVATDYRDADGMIDCWPGCTRFQDGVKIGYFGALPVLVLAVILLVSLRLLTWRCGRAARRPG